MDSVFSVFHKTYTLPKKRNYLPIIVGNSNSISSAIKYRDNSGDNISNLNPAFCELTAMYWIWKNYAQDLNDIVGLTHYRRYLFKNHFAYNILAYLERVLHISKPATIYGWQNVDVKDMDKYMVRDSFCNKILKSLKFKIIVPYPIKIDFPEGANSVRESYNRSHIASDLDITEDIIKKRYPEYLDSFLTIMDDNKLSICNMFITTRDVFNDYCQWLFPILFELYDKIKIENEKRDSFQKRSVGFIAERLLNVYIHKNFKAYEIFYLKQSFIVEK